MEGGEVRMDGGRGGEESQCDSMFGIDRNGMVVIMTE